MLRQLAVAREIFTREEMAELCKYEFAQLFEVAKQNVEWFAYAMVVLVWTGVAAMFVTIAKSPIFNESNAVIVRAEPRKVDSTVTDESKRKLSQFEKTCAEIDKASTSSYTSESIYFKVLSTCGKWKVDPVFVLALIEKESNFKEDAVASDYDKTESLGWSQAAKPMWDTFNAQYVWPTYNVVWPIEDKNNVDKALTFICWTVEWLKTHYSDKIKSTHDLYAAYNGGPTGINKKTAQKNADKFDEIYNRYFLAMN